MSITQHYFHNKTKSYAEAKYLGQRDQARVLFHLYEKGAIKLFVGWFKTFEFNMDNAVIPSALPTIFQHSVDAAIVADLDNLLEKAKKTK